MKKFGDLQKGDSVFVVTPVLEIHTLKVLDVKIGDSDIKLTLDDNCWSGHYTKTAFCAMSDVLWSDEGEVLEYTLERIKNRKNYLADTIDHMIQEYDRLEKLMKEYEVHN